MDVAEKYLAIKNWEKYQSGKGKMRWIKLAVHLEDDDEMLDLSVYQQGMLVMLWRLRGRSGRNLPNDPLKLCRKLSVDGQDRHNAVRAIGQLILSGWLIPTNQEDSFPNRPIDIDKNRKEEIKNESKNVRSVTLQVGVVDALIPDPPEGVDECVEQIQAAWKKPMGQVGMVACFEAFQFECRRSGCEMLEAARRVRDKTLIIAQLMAEWPPGEQKFIPKLTDFMRDQGYENEFTTWERGRGTDSPEPDARSAAEILRERARNAADRPPIP